MNLARWRYLIPLRLRSLFRRRIVEAELDEELRDHLERRTEEEIRSGLGAEEARRVALLELGGIEQRKEECREARGLRWLEEFAQDIRYGFRLLRKHPGFSTVVVLVLALGLGANTALFSLFNSVLLRALPVRHPEELVVVSMTNEEGSGFNSFSYPMYRELRDQNSVFNGILAQASTELNASYAGQSEQAHGELVSGNYFETLGVQAWRGRLFTPADDRTPGAHPVAVLSYGYWQRRFGGDPAIIGGKLILNDHPVTIIGVTPPRFYGTDLTEGTDIRLPMMMTPIFRPTSADLLETANYEWLDIIARRKAKISPAQAEAGIDLLYRQVHEKEIGMMSARVSDYRKRIERTSHLKLLPGSQGLRQLQEQFSHALSVLFGITLIVLLITCANLANLFLARNAARAPEIAMRLALGATRRRLVRQWLTESLLFASLGGSLGLLIAVWTQSALLHFLPAQERLNLGHATLEPGVFAFAFVASLVTAILFGIVPALQITRRSLASQGGETRLAQSDLSPHRFRGALVLLQMALSLPLLIGAGLFLHSLRNLKTIAPGFDENHVVLASLNPALNGYPPERTRALYDEFLRRVRSLPGVRSAALATRVVLSGSWEAPVVNVEGYQPREGEDMNPYENSVSPDYFATIHMPIVAGRDFNERDNLQSGKVAIINQTMARYFFGNKNPLGKKMGTDQDKPQEIEIVGVVQDAKYLTLREKPQRNFYLPVGQEPRLMYLTLHVRTQADARPIAGLLRQTLREIDPQVPLYDVTTLANELDDSLARDRLITWLSTAFGVLATLLATIGLYGVISFSVAQRTREIGIRMALGAQRGDVLRLVLRQVVWLVLLGAGLGVGISLGGVRALQSLLYEVRGADPLAFVIAVAVLLAAAALAAYSPARRATQVNPTVALRYQ
ncbi:MAG TPA: ABC transporter permease [Chthoniobacterales bacterium]|nr:ABC transporter permease [Chthoniobacterales bacterium]